MTVLAVILPFSSNCSNNKQTFTNPALINSGLSFKNTVNTEYLLAGFGGTQKGILQQLFPCFADYILPHQICRYCLKSIS